VPCTVSSSFARRQLADAKVAPAAHASGSVVVVTVPLDMVVVVVVPYSAVVEVVVVPGVPVVDVVVPSGRVVVVVVGGVLAMV
jgi:hypothetical protein